jgi:hypothetical protein
MHSTMTTTMTPTVAGAAGVPTRPGLLRRVARGLLALGAAIPFECWAAYAF